MEARPRPIVYASRCLGFDACRYDGASVPDAVIDLLRPHVEFRTPCPEVEIGLGVPRDPIRVVLVEDRERLVQPATGLDITDRMNEYTRSFLEGVREADGFVLKYRSPSCGLANVKAYYSAQKGSGHRKTKGFFGRAVQEAFPDRAVSDEGQLRNFLLREHFLTRLFIHAELRTMLREGTMNGLVRFHTRHKELLRLYSQKQKQILGRIVANSERKPVSRVLEEYAPEFRRAFATRPRRNSAINVFQHAMGLFKRELTPRDKRHFAALLEAYRNQKLPYSALIAVVRTWAVHFEREYFLGQSLIEPYPEEMLELFDSGKGRKIK